MYLTLDEYYLLAKKIITRFCEKKLRKRLYNDDECLSSIVDYAIKADENYDENIGTRDGYRVSYAKYALQHYITKITREDKIKHSEEELLFAVKDDNSHIHEEYQDVLNFVQESKLISDTHKAIFLMYQMEDCIYQDIGSKFHMSAENVRLIINKVIKTIQENYRV